MLKVCVCERAWLHIWQAHVSTGDLPSRCLRRAPAPPTSPNVYQSGAARGPSLRRALQNKTTSIGFEWGHGRQSVAFMSKMHTVCMTWIQR